MRVFRELMNSSPDAARECYDIAQRYLLAHGEHELCNPFLDVETRMAQVFQSYTDLKQLASEEDQEEADEDDFRLADVAYDYVVSEVTPLMALLSLNDRHEEARHVCQTALAMLPDEALEARLNTALRGELQEKVTVSPPEVYGAESVTSIAWAFFKDDRYS